MIRRLRRKFVLINMGLVTLVLLIVFTVLCTTSYQRLTMESAKAMRQAMGRDAGKPPPKLEIGGRHGADGPPLLTPVFCVLLTQQGGIASVSGENVQVSDALLAQAVQEALGSGREEGVLSSVDLRFLRGMTPQGEKIAFADRSRERDTMKSLVISSLLVGAGGLAAFYAVSVFLARWALRPAETAWERQRQFVADASHELKTPLTVILANTGILLSHTESTVRDQMKWVSYTRDEANRMKKLVDDLLFLARADAARAPAARIPLNFSDIVWSGLLPFESIAFERGVTLESVIEPDISLQGDEGQLRQLVAILLDNACKYAGEEGRVMLRLERGADKARLSVHNTGEAIPQADLAHIFERFYRADKSRARSQGGYGLGLAIAKSIAEGHKGKIFAESRAGDGTTFTAVLPLRHAPDAAFGKGKTTGFLPYTRKP